jgi:iron-sulfur cluster assembly protein
MPMSIKLTERAANRIKTYLAKRGKGEGLRVGVRPTGCSGLAYVIDFADHIEADDQVFEDRGVRVVINSKSLTYLQGSELDFVKEGLNESFKFNNPNVKEQCGCGESFSV